MTLSKRAQELVGSPSVIVESHKLCATDPFDSGENPQGYLNFGTAENHLMTKELLAKINSPLQLSKEHIQYNQLHGSEELQLAFSNFVKSYLKIPDLDATKVSVQTGLSAVCECLSFALFDEDDYLMIPTPYYSGFDFDFRKRFKVNFLEVELDAEKNFTHELEAFEKTLKSFDKKHKVKAILLTHPHNPTGEILSSNFIEGIVSFAKEHSLQIISDEIYALSTHKCEVHESLYLKAQKAGVKSHLLYGMAKDFSLAGLKVGFHYCEDEELTKIIQALSYFHPVSSQTCSLVTSLLDDKDFLESFIPLNQKRLSEAKSFFKDSLTNFKFLPCEAGLFLIWDATHLCKSFQDEKDLQQKLLNTYKVNVLKGADLGLRSPGYFRICFAREKTEVNELSKRLKDLK